MKVVTKNVITKSVIPMCQSVIYCPYAIDLALKPLASWLKVYYIALYKYYLFSTIKFAIHSVVRIIGHLRCGLLLGSSVKVEIGNVHK